MARHPNPDTPYKVRSVLLNGYTYAYLYRLVPLHKDDEDVGGGELVRRKIYIGTLDESLVLHPNNTLRLMDVNERRKLIFPENWDIAALSKLNGVQPTDQLVATSDSTNTGEPTISALAAEERFPLYNNKVYGDFWFCEEVLKLKGVRDDLLVRLMSLLCREAISVSV